MLKFLKNLRNYKIEIIAILLFIILRIPSFFEGPLHTDEGVYLSVGKNLLQDEILYRDIWDHKPPFIYFLNSLLLLTEDFYTAIIISKILGFVLSAITIISLYSIVKKYIGFHSQKIKLVFCILLAFLFGSFAIEATVTNAENLFVPINLFFIYMLFYFFFTVKDKLEHSRKRIFFISLLSGLLLFLSFTIKITGFIESVFLYFLILLYFVFHKNYKYVFYFLIPSGIVFIILFSTLLIYFHYQNALFDFYHAIIGSNLIYVEQGNDYTHILGADINFSTLKIILFFITTMGLLSATIKKKFDIKIGLVLSIFCVELTCVTLSGRSYPHYLQQLIPSVFILSTLGLNKLITFSKHIKVITVSGFLILISIFIYHFSAERLHEAKPYLYYYAGFVNEYILQKSSNYTFQKWSSNSYYTRAKKLSIFIRQNYPEDRSYFLYSEAPWLELNFPFKSTNLLTVSFQQNMGENLLEKEKANLSNSDYIIIDKLYFRESDLFNNLEEKFKLTEVYDDYEIWKRDKIETKKDSQ